MKKSFPKIALCLLGAGLMPGIYSAPLESSRVSSFDDSWSFARYGVMPDGSQKNEPGAKGTAIRASSSEGHNTTAMAIDGDPSTRWCATRSGAGQYLILDMGLPTEARKCEILWEKAGIHQFKIDGSEDGNDWKLIYDGKDLKEKSDRNTTDLTGKARYYRLTVLDDDAAMWASVREWTFTDSSGNKILPQPGAESRMAPPSQPEFDDSGWRTLDLPHDWGIEGPFRMELPNNTGKLPWVGIGWYRKDLAIPADSKGNRFYLDFDGAMSCPQIYVNGQLAGEWKYGYSSFRVDLTPFLKFGEKNVIAVRLDNPPNSSRWYPGGGIYRHVRLTETNPVHLENWGVFAWTPEVSKEKAELMVESTIVNHSDKSVSPTVVQKLMSGDKVVATTEVKGNAVAPGQKGTIKSPMQVATPVLWDVDNPHLYQLRTTVLVDGKSIDTKDTRVGIRKMEWTTDDGFHLNGRRVELKGVCQHHDLGPLGGAVYKRGYERQVEILKEMGVNAIRTSHNPPAPELLEVCDEQGILVMDELFDAWEAAKNENDYHLYFKEWHERDLVNFVHRDRNHPCIILWSGGNEVHEQGNPSKHYISQRLTDLFHREDPSRKVGIGCSGAGGIKNGFADTVDVFGANYKAWQYHEYVKIRPNLPAFGSETSSCVSSRGEYFFPVKWDKGAGFFNFQVSSYDLYAPPWAYRPDVEFKGLDQNKRIGGEFVWTGFDYLGEPTPYNHDPTNALNFSNEKERQKAMDMFEKMGKYAPSRSSYFGIVDLCGFKKDRFYLYQARWLPELKMAHILPHWNWPDRKGEVTPVHVYTSGDSAELFLNGKSQGVRKKGSADDNAYRLVWDEVKYEPGELKVVVTKDGKPWATDLVQTTGKETQFTIEADRAEIKGDGKDLSYLTITIRDAQGRMVPVANTELTFTLEGPGEIIGVCNGDATDLGSFQANTVKAYNGLAQVIIRGKKNESGKAVLKTSAKGMPATETVINVIPAKR